MRATHSSPRIAFAVAATLFPLGVATLGCGAGGTTGAVSTTGTASTAAGGSPTSGSPTTGSENTCTQTLTTARLKMRAVIQANQACTSDADCTATGLSAMCFDSCSAAINKGGAAAVEAVRDQVNEAECKTYQSSGCPALPVPPCAPPGPPRCQAGICI